MIMLGGLIRGCPLKVAVAGLGERCTSIVDFIRGCVLVSATDDCRLVSAGMKLWMSLCYLMESTIEESSVHTLETSLSAETIELLSMCFECMENKGAVFSRIQIKEESDLIVLRECAATCVFSLLKLRRVGPSLGVEQWHLLGWSLLDTSASTRRHLAHQLYELIQTHAVHPRILALPCLLATDDALNVAASKALMFAVRRLRATHRQLCTQALESENEALRKTAEVNMPETILPFVLHLLSHHPEFPASAAIDGDQDKRRLKSVLKSLNMVLDVLLGSAATNGDNLSFLFKQVHLITSYYTDRVDVDNAGLSFVTRITRKLLSDRIRSADNTVMFPGDVSLPMDLYELCEEERQDGAAAERAVTSALSKVTGGRAPKRTKGLIETPTRQKDKSTRREMGILSKKSKRSKGEQSDESEVDVEMGEEEAEEMMAKEPIMRPLRSGRVTKAIKYTEPAEDDRETRRWDEAAGRQMAEQRRAASIRSHDPDQENVFNFGMKSLSAQKRKSSSPNKVHILSSTFLLTSTNMLGI
jgi:hypothetical protein